MLLVARLPLFLFLIREFTFIEKKIKKKKYEDTETNYTDEATKSGIIQFKYAYLGEYNQKTLQLH